MTRERETEGMSTSNPVVLATVVEGNQKVPFSVATPLSGLLHLPLICTLYCWVLNKEVSSTIL